LYRPFVRDCISGILILAMRKLGIFFENTILVMDSDYSTWSDDDEEYQPVPPSLKTATKEFERKVRFLLGRPIIKKKEIESAESFLPHVAGYASRYWF
jgi:hypothetical protein